MFFSSVVFVSNMETGKHRIHLYLQYPEYIDGIIINC